MRLIDADSLKEKLDDLPVLSIEFGGVNFGDVIECIDCMPTLSEECCGLLEIQALRECLAAVSKERDELRAVVCQCSVCAGTGFVAICDEPSHTAYLQRCTSCNGNGIKVNASPELYPRSIMGV